mgnify:FL=1
MAYKGIDVSEHNGCVDWSKAKAAGLQFAILRLGFGGDIESQDDAQFERNVSECERLEIPWGAYLYSYALNTTDALSEAKHALRLLKGKRPTYPIVIDMEDADGYKARHGGVNGTTCTRIIKTFCATLEANKYYVGYYCNRCWHDSVLNLSELSAYDFWFARPGVSAPDRKCGIWQSSFPDTGGRWPGANIPGGGCDLDISYRNYPAIIKAAGLNGWPKGTAKTKLSIDTHGEFPIPKGSTYTFRVTCGHMPQIVAGSPSFRYVSCATDECGNYYPKFLACGNMGDSCGFYLEGSKKPVAIGIVVRRVKVTADILNIRKNSGTQFPIVGTTRYGWNYLIDRTAGRWGHVYRGSGWICLDYTKDV